MISFGIRLTLSKCCLEYIRRPAQSAPFVLVWLAIQRSPTSGFEPYLSCFRASVGSTHRRSPALRQRGILDGLLCNDGLPSGCNLVKPKSRVHKMLTLRKLSFGLAQKLVSLYLLNKSGGRQVVRS